MIIQLIKMFHKKENKLNIPLIVPIAVIGAIVLIVLIVVSVIVLAGLGASSQKNSFNLFKPYKIAVIPVKGVISLEESNLESTLSVERVIQNIKDANADSSVGAIVLEINSPGGGVIATKQIVQEIRDVNKPIVAFISDIGASGGYYIAAASDEIVADEDSLTGSIGVITELINLKELLEKHGVKVTILKEGKFKAIGSPFKDLTAEEEKIFQDILRQAYENFKGDIKKFRGERLKPSFDEITDGRILSGKQAKEHGLIDFLGNKQTAINRATELAGIESPEIVNYSEKEFSFNQLFSELGYAFGKGFRTSFKEESQLKGIQS